MKEYAKSIQDLDFLIPKGEIHVSYYNVYNLRGVNYGWLGNLEEACKSYKMAADMGDSDGQNNYAKLCQKGK
jgi:Tfp pilus assembly protein PilF